MEEFFYSDNFPYYLLMFLRVTGLFILSPIFGRRNVPARLKIGLSIALTYIFSIAFPPTEVINTDVLVSYLFLCVKELLIGLIMGYISILFFYITYTAGYIIDVQMGLGLSNLFDPSSSSQVSATGSLLNLLMIIYFFMSNGHHMLIKILYATFSKLPVGGFSISFNVIPTISEAFILSMTIAFNLMIPIIAASLLAELALGIIIRTVPQMNAFVVGIPLKIFVGFVILLLMQPVYVGFSSMVFEKMYSAIESVFGGMYSR